MDAPAAVLALILVETAVGTLLLTWLGPTWGKVRSGYEILQTSLAGLMLLGAWAALDAPLATVLDEGARAVSLAEWTDRLLVGAAIGCGVAVAARAVRVTQPVARAVGILTSLAAAAAIVPLAGLRTVADGGGWALGIAEVALGALFLGGIWSGMILGHWYLVERRLSNEYMVWMARMNVAAVVAGAAAVALSSLNPVPCEGLSGDELVACGATISPLLTVGNLTLWIGYGVVALVGVIAYFNLKLAHEGGRSIQASTGMFYLAVILAPAAEFASKLRFF